MSIKRKPGRVIYENDLILSEIVSAMVSKAALREFILTSKRSFAIGTKALYKEVKSDILEKLGKKNCFLRHIPIYLEAVRTVVYPAIREGQKMYPNSFHIPSLRQSFPNIKTIKFILPQATSYSIIHLYDPPAAITNSYGSTVNTVVVASNKLGEICLVMDDSVPHHTIFSESMGIYGPRAQYHLTGLRLGAAHGIDQNVNIRYYDSWHTPIAPLIPPHCLGHPNDFKHIQERSWTPLFRHLTELSLTNGCTSRYVLALIASAPSLKRLTLYSRGHSDNPLDTEERTYSADAVLGRLMIKLEDRVSLDAVIFGSGKGYHPGVSDDSYASARDIVADWSLEDIIPLKAMEEGSFEEWKNGFEASSISDECNTVGYSVPHNVTDKNPFAVGLALSMMLPHRVKFEMHLKNGAVDALGKWVEHVREGRLHGIQLLEKDHRPGFRLKKHDPDREHCCSTPDSAYSDGGESCCIEYSNPHAAEEAEDAWDKLSLSEKMRVLKKGGIELTEREALDSEEEY